MRARIDELIRDISGVPFKGLGSRSRCNMPCRAGAPAAFSASTGWCIAFPVSAGSNGSRSCSAGIVIERMSIVSPHERSDMRGQPTPHVAPLMRASFRFADFQHSYAQRSSSRRSSSAFSRSATSSAIFGVLASAISLPSGLTIFFSRCEPENHPASVALCRPWRAPGLEGNARSRVMIPAFAEISPQARLRSGLSPLGCNHGGSQKYRRH